MLIHWDHASVSLNAVWSFYLLVGALLCIDSRRRFALRGRDFRARALGLLLSPKPGFRRFSG
jgi:hypothetical protein